MNRHIQRICRHLYSVFILMISWLVICLLISIFFVLVAAVVAESMDHALICNWCGIHHPFFRMCELLTEMGFMCGTFLLCYFTLRDLVAANIPHH